MSFFTVIKNLKKVCDLNTHGKDFTYIPQAPSPKRRKGEVKSQKKLFIHRLFFVGDELVQLHDAIF